MVKIYIDDIECNYTIDEAITLTHQASDLIDTESGRTGFTFEVLMPHKGGNSAIFGSVADIHPLSKFNSQWHPMRVEVDSVEIISGTAYLVGVVVEDGEQYLKVQCQWGAEEWAEQALATSLKEVPIDYSAILTLEHIEAGWEDDSTVKFFPIIRDSYEAEGSDSDVTGVRKVSTIDDYHPFINLYSLFVTFFDSIGYHLESEFFESEMAKALYMSGNYSSSESDAAREAMGFYVKRAEDSSTTADTLGRVWLSPNLLYNSVGNLADLSTTTSDSECYNHGGVLQISSEALIYKPLTSISVGFEYNLSYTTDCTIKSREALTGIDTLDTIDNGAISWVIENRNEDQRDKLVAGVEYSLVIFDYDPDREYCIVGAWSDNTGSMVATPNAKLTKVTFNTIYDSLTLGSRVGNESYTADESDWALYFGYVEDSSTVDIDVTVRCSPDTFSPTSTQKFERMVLKGGDAGCNFTLKAGSSIKPYYAAYPGYNSDIEFSDVAQHQVSVSEILAALQHLFNLRIYSCESSKRVIIEPFDSFYDSSSFDWSDKVVEGVSIEHRDWAFETHRSNKLGYQQEDGVVNRTGYSDNATFGEWSYEVNSYAASSTDQTTLNPIFSATTNDDDGILLVGDRDDIDSVDSLNFAPRIVRLFGMIDGDYSSRYPYASFHSPDDGFTLCFEDRDEAEGLNRYYQNQVELLERASLITLSLELTSLEWSNLFSPLDSAASLRSEFCFTLKGESFKTRLYSVESYDIENGVARCTFLTID